ncbi:hypothetical protein SK128_003674 [Halocaridina rubra]|uniref:Chitin-binding type-2 domain-containing protein n=1 Tax=Halocaridina rubra TaxID=373956 RepID=A0AAN8XDX2_HALRR
MEATRPIILLLSLMVLGQTKAESGSSNITSNVIARFEASSGLDLRQSSQIPFQCTSPGAKSCLDCGRYPFCASAGNTAYEISCGSRQVCENAGAGGNGICLPFNDARVSQCRCDARYVDDPFDATGNKYLTCLVGGEPILSQCPTGQVFDFTNEVCSTTAANIICTDNGVFSLTCSQGYFCSGPQAVPLILQCLSGELFDASQGGCVPQNAVTIPPFACGTEDGAVVDNLECDAFRVCMAGTEQGTGKNCCPTGQVFSGELMRCTTDPSIVTCPQLHPCDNTVYTYTCSGSGTPITNPPIPPITPGPGTGTGVNCSAPTCSSNGAFPYTSDCKRFYYCSGGRFFIQKCTTRLYFDSTQRVCTTLEKLTGCACI